MAYTYDPKNYEEKVETIPVGDYRVRIEEIEMTETKNGDDMLKIWLEVSGKPQRLVYYLPLLGNTDYKAMTDRKIGSLLEAFGQDTKSQPNWQALVGKVGACRIKHEIYQEQERAAVHYFILRKKQENLPPWTEPRKKPQDKPQLEEVSDNEELPF